jgi:Phage tail assembly chaperone proteins, E, or 41 or 14
MEGSISFPLSRPINAHGKELKELSLRAPTGAEVRRIGMPFKTEITNAAQMQHINTGVIAEYVVTLAQIPSSSVDAIVPRDWPGLSAAVMGFFGDETRENS